MFVSCSHSSNGTTDTLCSSGKAKVAVWRLLSQEEKSAYPSTSLLPCHRYNRFRLWDFSENTSGVTVSRSDDPHPEVRGQTHWIKLNNELLFRRSDAVTDKKEGLFETWNDFSSENTVDTLHFSQACCVETPNCLFYIKTLCWLGINISALCVSYFKFKWRSKLWKALWGLIPDLLNEDCNKQSLLQ